MLQKSLTNILYKRSEIEEEREINHHGKSRSVKAGNDNGSPSPTTISVTSSDIGFDKNLVSVREEVQDKALRDFYSKVKVAKGKRKVMDRCVMFSRRVKPALGFTFIAVYWVSGLINYQKME